MIESRHAVANEKRALGCMNRAEVLLGTTLDGGRYRLDVVVTESPDLFVFGGEDTKTSAPITIRMPRAPRGMSMEELSEAYDKFAIEAEQLKQLSKSSPHVEKLLASGEVESPDRERLAYCVFARVDGSSLAEMRGKGALTLSRAVRLLDPIASALATAHDQGVFHGDVRPDNMILVEDAELPALTLIRFTLATRLGPGTRTFAPQYGAPEHFKKSFGDSSVGAPADTYGLALCLVELVTGSPALAGSSTTEFYKQTTDITRRPTLRGRGVDVSQEIDTIIARAVAVNPKLRWPTAKAFWSALASLTGLGSLTEPAAFAITPLSSLATSPEEKEAEADDQKQEQPGDEALRPSSPASITPNPAIPPPPGSQRNQIAPPKAPMRVPARSTPSVVPAPPSTPKPKSTTTTTPTPKKAEEQPTIRRLDEGAVDSHPPAADHHAKRMRMFVVLGAVIALIVVVVIIVLASSHKTPISSNDADASVAPFSPPPTAESASAEPHLTPKDPSIAPILGIQEPPPNGMIRVEAGSFKMGKDTEGKGDRPAHRVTLTRAYYIDKLEVSAEAYSACVDASACTARLVHVKKTVSGGWGCNFEKDRATHPANCIDRKQAAQYCTFLKKRLPTEAEWEYAARGADERDYPWGNTPPTSCTTAILSGMSGGCGDRKGTSAVGSTTADGASAVGALDMGGNVWEWVADDYATYPSDDITDPLVTITEWPVEGPAPRGILRGGSWDYGPQSAKATYRLPFMAEAGNASIGVRCAKTAD